MRNIPPSVSALFWTQFFGALNDNLFKNALIILITYKSIILFGLNSGMLVALCGGLFILPYLLFSATAGQLADKFEKSWLVIKIKEVEIAIAIVGAVGLYLENFPLLLVVLFLLGVQSTFFGPLKYSLIPHYSSKEQLVFSNALISSGTFSAILLGTIAGGIAAGFENTTWPVIVLLLFFSYLALHFAWRLPKTNQAKLDSETKNIVVDWNLYSSNRDILKLVFRNQRIAFLILGLSWFWFLGAGLLSLLPLIAKNIFNGQVSIATLMLFTFVLGMGAGPFALEKIFKGKVPRWVIPMSLIMMTLVIFDLSFVIKAASKHSFFLSLIDPVNLKDYFQLNMSVRMIFDLFVLSVFGGMFTVSQLVELQRITVESELSRVVAGNNIVNALLMVLVSILLMVLHQQKMPLFAIMAVLGIFNVFMCIVLLFFYKDEFNKIWRF